jgi:(p)ppGpp synthase/HD superfamily hydrolase
MSAGSPGAVASAAVAHAQADRTGAGPDDADAALDDAFAGVKAKPGKGVDHAREVARVLRGAGCDDAVVVAGLMHDVVEDTPWTIADVRARFGPAVATLVAAVTEDVGVTNYRPRKRALRAQIAAAGPDAIDIALADKVASLGYALATGSRVPKRKVAHYEATLAVAGGAAHPDLGAQVASRLAAIARR